VTIILRARHSRKKTLHLRQSLRQTANPS
jgi:hypothetical protein